MTATFEDVIARPVEDVFDAIIDPAKMANYFVSSADGAIAAGKTLTWTFADAGVSISVQVTKVEACKHIQFHWPASGPGTTVDIFLEARQPGITGVKIVESSWIFNKEGITRAMQQTIGWTHFFCCLKAYLLFNVNLRTGQVLPPA